MTKNNPEQPLKNTVWFRMTPAERQRLVDIAAEEGRSLSDTVRRALIEHFRLHDEAVPMT